MPSNGERPGPLNRTATEPAAQGTCGSQPVLHPAWIEFIRCCEKLQHGEIERLRIQDGLPVLAELTTKKVRFG